MKEIKFRAWDEKKKAMLYDGEEIAVIDFHSGVSLSYKLQSWDILKSHDIVMQYTGLKDKNGKEIYEGDFIKHPFEAEYSVGVVTYNQGHWDVMQQSTHLFDVAIMYEDDWKQCEVLGNIHENPELA